jgi:hypothetical protein
MNDSDKYASCTLCGKPIRMCEKFVTIGRNVERHNAEMMIEVLESVVLVQLCIACGERNPESVINVMFEGAR